MRCDLTGAICRHCPVSGARSATTGRPGHPEPEWTPIVTATTAQKLRTQLGVCDRYLHFHYLTVSSLVKGNAPKTAQFAPMIVRLFV